MPPQPPEILEVLGAIDDAVMFAACQGLWSVEFSADASREIDELVGRYPERLGALIPVLFVAQREFGYLTREVFEVVAERLDVPTAQVLNTASFYTLLYKKPVGRHHVQICRNVSCFLRGADALTACLGSRLGLSNGDVSQDKQFSLELVECLAACGGAPVVRINETYHENVTLTAFESLLDGLAAGSEQGVSG